jgi:hypothetical protein
MFLEMSNYPTDHRDCMRQAIKELVPDYELRELYTIYGITKEQYINDMSNAYLRYKANKVSEQWQKANSTEQ